MKSVVNHLDDLKLASYRIEEVERLIAEEKLKLKHSNIYIFFFIILSGVRLSPLGTAATIVPAPDDR
jgi:hypothetical protein